MLVKMKMYLSLIQLMKCFWYKLFFPNTKCPEMTHLACNILDLQCVPFSFGFGCWSDQMPLFANNNIPEPFYGTKFVAVKIHQQFAQAIMGRCEVDFDLGFLSRFNTG